MKPIAGDISLRRLSEDDIQGLITLSAAVGWDYEQEEVLTVLKSGTVLGHKTMAGVLISCAALIPYDRSLAWLGLVITDPGFRGKGLAKKVVQGCLELAADGTSILLVATEEGRPLYLKLGFSEVDTIHKYLCRNYNQPAVPEKGKVSIIKGFSPDYFESLVEFDKPAFGDGRTVFLKNRIAQAKRCLLAFDAEGKLIGYGLSIQGPVNLILGPIAAEDTETASLLLDRLANGHQGQLRIDVPSGQDDFMKILEYSGFTLSASPPVMVLHAEAMPARNGRLFALAAQAFG
ncbi:GNAT family N-acetyltransferase [Bacillus infantis]|uniref:GNAT family N-acetyltransferase n=1 Tax=Bacillus infantis TaxID=324767 RepID=UPI001CD4A556|nr:GNAT family N-acetyltransferase [Bacillus infantis]MCA1035160.1 GNAT family N-acetyltransferase [Bacillus infantis]